MPARPFAPRVTRTLAKVVGYVGVALVAAGFFVLDRSMETEGPADRHAQGLRIAIAGAGLALAGWFAELAVDRADRRRRAAGTA